MIDGLGSLLNEFTSAVSKQVVRRVDANLSGVVLTLLGYSVATVAVFCWFATKSAVERLGYSEFSSFSFPSFFSHSPSSSPSSPPTKASPTKSRITSPSFNADDIFNREFSLDGVSPVLVRRRPDDSLQPAHFPLLAGTAAV